MNKALEYMIANPKKVLNQAKKLTKNLERAEDVVQDVMLYFHECPEKQIDNPASYVWLTLFTFNINNNKQWDKKAQYDKVSHGGDLMSHFDTIPAPNNFDSVEHKMTLENTMDLAILLCSEKQINAMIESLSESDIKNETTRSHERSGILRLQQYFLGEVVGIPKHITCVGWSRNATFKKRKAARENLINS